jgi:putative intracellular protease/amidase
MTWKSSWQVVRAFAASDKPIVTLCDGPAVR